MTIIISDKNSPAFNLALEERLLAEGREDTLLLYINSPSVIVGRNQNPEAEADTIFCWKNDIPVIKRVSGGGTVYHDKGNINYSFIVNKGENNALDTDFLKPVTDVLNALGINAIQGKRKELLLDGKKISGTASHIKKGKVLFHGTLLYDTDLGMLEKAINGDASKRGKKVASVSSPVTNIKEEMGFIEPTPAFFDRLTKEFMKYYFVTEVEKAG